MLTTFASVLLIGNGCSAFRGTMQTITLDATVPGASIAIDGKDMGEVPVTLEVRRNAYMTIVISKPGYATKTATPRPKMSGTGVADALGAYACLLPGIGVLTPGAWKFKPDYIVFELEPAPVLPLPETLQP